MSNRSLRIFILLLGLMAAAITGSPALAKPGNAENGEKIYAQRCMICHGAEGDGQGAATELLNPPPRDFTSAMYKIKTTGFDDIVPNDEDIMRMIRDGMPAATVCRLRPCRAGRTF